MRLYHDPIHRPAQPADTADIPDPGPMDGPVDGTVDSIDLERALWDTEYRRQVLEILRRGRRGEDQPPAPPAPESQNGGDT